MRDIHHLHISFHVKDVGVEGLSLVTLHPETKNAELQRLVSESGAEEVFYLPTCNRTEFYFVGQNPILCPVFAIEPTCVRENVGHIVEHLLEVALSVDSIVFGESQILGQFKRAYENALESSFVRSNLSPLLNAVIREAKAIRAKVGLTQIHTSVATVAGQMVSALPIQSVLMIGAGETTQTFGMYLKKRRPYDFFWCTRNFDRARSAADACGGHRIPWEGMSNLSLLPKVDLICVATHSSEILVDQAVLKATGATCVVDLSVPPNASKAHAVACGVRYIGIDQLNEKLESAKSSSSGLVALLQSEINVSTDLILNDWKNRKAGGFFSQINSAGENILELELESLLSKMATLQPDQKKSLQVWSRRLVKKINHLHFQTLKRILSPEAQQSDQDNDQLHG